MTLLEVARHGAALGGGVVSHHPAALPVAGEHHVGGRGAAGGELGRQAAPAGVGGDAAVNRSPTACGESGTTRPSGAAAAQRADGAVGGRNAGTAPAGVLFRTGIRGLVGAVTVAAVSLADFMRSVGVYDDGGADPAKETDKFTVRDFRTDCLRELKKIKDAWPDPHYASYLARAAAGRCRQRYARSPAS